MALRGLSPKQKKSIIPERNLQTRLV